MNYKRIHIGKLIQTFVKENHINTAELARKLGKTRQNLYDLYKRDDIDVKLFLTISEVLNHDFLADLYEKKEMDCVLNTVLDALKELISEKISKNTIKK
ncbi:MAG: hypothetical protein LBU51_11250 [Bacteroidales bacterium]|jgi:hypothetical protein|nr:hypothetical protein [Bacteroidales bacterium]